MFETIKAIMGLSVNKQSLFLDTLLGILALEVMPFVEHLWHPNFCPAHWRPTIINNYFSDWPQPEKRAASAAIHADKEPETQ